MTTTKIPIIYLIEENIKNSAYLRGAIVDTEFKCDIRVFDNGESAIEELFSGTVEIPDMILLSLTLTDIDGMDVLKKIKGDDNLKGVPTIVLGDGSDQALVKEAYANYANSYIKKVKTIGDYMAVVQNLKNLWFMRFAS